MDFIHCIYEERVVWGLPQGESLQLIQGNPLEGYTMTEERISLKKVKYLPPVEKGGKIVCVGWNYLKHTREDERLPDLPTLFLKAPSALTGHKEPLLVPPEITSPKYEAEIAVVIGKKVKRLQENEVQDCILGYTCANDFTAREVLEKEKYFSRAKGYDTFAPLGPVLKTDYDYCGKTLKSYVNGNLWQEGTTDEMIFRIEPLIAFISTVMTLEPWDIVFTGTPRNSKVVKIGDKVLVSIEGLGDLETPVVREQLKE